MTKWGVNWAFGGDFVGVTQLPHSTALRSQ
jgi:hypothetical protein